MRVNRKLRTATSTTAQRGSYTVEITMLCPCGRSTCPPALACDGHVVNGEFITNEVRVGTLAGRAYPGDAEEIDQLRALFTGWIHEDLWPLQARPFLVSYGPGTLQAPGLQGLLVVVTITPVPSHSEVLDLLKLNPAENV